MKNYLLLLILFLGAACSRTSTITVGALTLPARPRAGEQIEIQYHRSNTGILGEKNLRLILYYTVKNTIYAESVTLSNTGNPTKTSFILPDSAQAFALKFQLYPNVVDNENEYIFPVYNRSGKPVAGAHAGMSLFYNDMGSSLLGNAVNKEMVLKLMEEDFEAHPEIKHAWMEPYLHTLLNVKKKSGYAKTKSLLQQMLSSESIREGDYHTAYKLYLQMGMWKEADSMMSLGPKMFPRGEMAMYAILNDFPFQESSIDSMMIHYKDFKQKFPARDMQSTAAKMQDLMLRKIASQYAAQGDYHKFSFFISQLYNPQQRAGVYNNMARELAENGKALGFADSISKISLNLIQRSMDHPGQEKQTYQSSGEWKDKMQRLYANYSDTYALILSKERKIQEAVAYQKQAVEYSRGEDAGMSKNYIQYLMAVKDYKTAQQQLEGLIIHGVATDELNAYLKPIYVHLNHTETGYLDYYHILEKKAKAKLEIYLSKEIVNKAAPDFTLPDLKGKRISLAALKGKVVVLDFWATWCEPCINSLPGMQQVVDHYKNDSSVAFLFVNTGEKSSPGQRYKQVYEFISNNKYTFKILLDQIKTDDSTKYRVLNDYKVNAIPTQFVIDPKGHIRFEKLGFSGSTPAEIREVSMMVEMARRRP